MTYVDVTVLGDINIDVIVRVPGGILEDSSTIASDLTVMPGGVGANIASNLVSLNLRTRILGSIGDDVFGRFLLEKLGHRGIDTRYVRVIDKEPTGFMIVLVWENGRKTIIGSRGANKYFELDEETIGKIVKETKHLHVSGYAALNNDRGRTLLKLLSSTKRNNKTTSIDLEGIAQYSPSFIEQIRGLVDYVFLNRVEALHLCENNDLTNCMSEILLRTNAKALFLKMGERGSIVIARGDKGFTASRIKPFKVIETIDCTGAGDAYNAAVIASLINGKSLIEAAYEGNKAGAEACKRIGGFKTS